MILCGQQLYIYDSKDVLTTYKCDYLDGWEGGTAVFPSCETQLFDSLSQYQTK